MSSLASPPARDIAIVPYESETRHLPLVRELIEADLSEPYSVFTYRYFLRQWPLLAFLAVARDRSDEHDVTCGARPGRSSGAPVPAAADTAPIAATATVAHRDPPPSSLPRLTLSSSCIGCIVARLERHANRRRRGYIAMLAVRPPYRRTGIATQLVRHTIRAMVASGCDEVVLEAEVTNLGALRLYEGMGFMRDKRLERYYLNGADAFRLKLPLSAALSATTDAA